MSLVDLGQNSDCAIIETTQSLGLRAATPAETYGTFAALKVDVELMAAQGRLDEFQSLFAQAWKSKDRLPSGERLYSAMLGWVQVGAPDDAGVIATYLAPFAAEFERHPTPLSAALYAEALHNAAFVAHETEGEHDELTSQALTVLHSVANVADADVAWWSARYALTQSDGSSNVERLEILTKLVAIDPGSITVFTTAMVLALPDWFGQNESDTEDIARWAMEANYEHWGAGGYAIAYWALTSAGDLDAAETSIDAALAEQGFRDLLDRAPSNSVTNMFAQTMSWVNAESIVKEIFDGGLQAIDPAAWGAESDAQGVDLAARAYHWAKNDS